MKYIKESIKIKNVEIRNRLVMPPMAISKANDGTVTQELIDYYDEKSKGGHIGLIIIEHCYVNKQGMASPGQLSISRDSDIEGLKKITETIHKNNTKVIVQISHAGSSANPKFTGFPSVSASAVLNEGATGKNNIVPEEMNEADIEKVIHDFAEAARRAKEAGFDGVEIHSAHAYLLNQFYSPLTNKRKDEYTGNTIEGRIQLHLKIIKAVREIVEEQYIIALRLGASDYTEGGTTLSDSVQAAKIFQKNGVDLLDVSGGFCGFIRPGYREEGYFSELTEAISKEVSIPVILTGGIVNGDTAETLLKEKKADMIGVGRAILKDSNWAEKVMSKKYEKLDGKSI